MTPLWFWPVVAVATLDCLIVARLMWLTAKRSRRRVEVLAERCTRDRHWENKELREREFQTALRLREQRLTPLQMVEAS